MSAQTPPYAIQASSHGAELFRRAVASMLPHGRSTRLASTGKGGLVVAGDLAVAQHGAGNMSVDVAAGEVWIPGTVGANQGAYYGLNDGTVNLTISAANPTNPRIDLVCATVDDAAYSGSTNDWKLQVITGTPTAGATLANLLGAPSLPANSLALNYVLVPTNASSIVTADISASVAPLAFAEPAVIAYRGSNFNTTASAWTLLPFDTVDTDNYSGFNTGTHLYTVPVAGLYLVTVCLGGGNGSTDGIVYGVGVQKNGSNWLYSYATAGSGSSSVPAASFLMRCSAGDTLGGLYYVAGVETVNGGTPPSGTAYSFLNIAKVSD